MSGIGGTIGKRWTAVVVAVAVTLSAFLVMNARLAVLERVEAEVSDLHFRIRGAETPDPRTVIVTADEKAAAELGRWPFSQRYFAVAIDRLSQDGAKAIAFDVVFPQAELPMSTEIRDKLIALV